MRLSTPRRSGLAAADGDGAFFDAAPPSRRSRRAADRAAPVRRAGVYQPWTRAALERARAAKDAAKDAAESPGIFWTRRRSERRTRLSPGAARRVSAFALRGVAERDRRRLRERRVHLPGDGRVGRPGGRAGDSARAAPRARPRGGGDARREGGARAEASRGRRTKRNPRGGGGGIRKPREERSSGSYGAGRDEKERRRVSTESLESHGGRLASRGRGGGAGSGGAASRGGRPAPRAACGCRAERRRGGGGGAGARRRRRGAGDGDGRGGRLGGARRRRGDRGCARAETNEELAELPSARCGRKGAKTKKATRRKEATRVVARVVRSVGYRASCSHSCVFDRVTTRKIPVLSHIPSRAFH